MKQVRELRKENKIEVIRSIANGDIDRRKVNPDTFVATTKSDGFMGTIMEATSSEGTNVVYIGEAKKTLEEIKSHFHEPE